MKRGRKGKPVVRLSDGKWYPSIWDASLDNYWDYSALQQKVKQRNGFEYAERHREPITGKHREFAQRLCAVVEPLGLPHVSYETGIQIGHLQSRYMTGNTMPNTESVCKICECCNVSADWLLGLSDICERR